MSEAAKYAPIGLLALAPRAYGELFTAPSAPGCEELGAVAVVNVRGPLMHHVDPCFDSYDEIKARVGAALKSSARAVVLRIDSPGGLVSGCFDTVRELRGMAAVAGKPLIGFAEQASSAAYALLCSCSVAYAAAAGAVGSIGVIDTIVDVTAADIAQGVKFALVTSGARKADGNPHTPLSDVRLAATQANVDAVAELFFELVAETRPGLDVGTVRGLEAATFPGVIAESKRLVDGLATFDQVLAIAASGSAATAAKEVPVDYEKAVAALRKVAEGDDANAKAAKRALAALDTDGEDKDKPKDDEAKAADDKGEDKPKDDEAKAKAEDDKDKPEAKAAAPASAQAIDTKTLKAEIKAEMRAEAEDAAKRAGLLATRPDISATLRAKLSAMSASEVESFLAEIPKVVTPAQAAIAGGTAKIDPTLGDKQVPGGTGAVSALSPHAALLDRQMGLTNEGKGVRSEGNQLILSAAGAKVEK